MNEQENTEKAKRTFTEEVEVAGNQVMTKVQELVKQGNIRRLIVQTPDGRTLLDTTLTAGVGVGTVAGFFGGIPLMLLAGATILLTKVQIKIVREISEGDVIESKQKVDIKVDEE